MGIACGSGMFAWCFAHPFEMWKNTTMMAPPGTSQVDCFRRTASKGFFTGLSSGIARQVVYSTARLGCYPIFRDSLLTAKVQMGYAESADPKHATLLDRAIAGGSAGAFASCLSSPVEVCLVLQTTGETKMSILGAAKSVLRSNGIAGFWRGLGPLTARAALVGVSQVAVHDQVLTKLRLRNKQRAAPLNDNLVINIASIITAFIYSMVTMPVEVARVRMSAEAKAPKGVEKKYHNAVQCVARVIREEGAKAIFTSYVPYFGRCGSHTVVCFFAIEYATRVARERRAAAAAKQ
ncbi:solute carrier family 25 (mitochondrial oxoglutarate transporter), member 11 [Strigomonas culicis]|uniref:Solute carrier family 25 (Mitochondrial oxoglutarate transporter), member 11 n=1 Tax=Strigomonas culicis TaxID=28005 RepID=S9WHD6_9TRYP|nr:solute carrier family 25 (mitochondrial oxoglutarate transporter), member 11 [Strigomonas culicis]|eukprot:EPY35230.1 solute carrier family 25 (mitochondrial oxoglutarate transporter), member 11 [Strigomonas culicis]